MSCPSYHCNACEFQVFEAVTSFLPVLWPHLAFTPRSNASRAIGNRFSVAVTAVQFQHWRLICPSK